MKVQVICGFLGAGKTTLLKNILEHQDSDTVVLVNEFGELGIDGTLISEGNTFNVVEMPSGCICCTLKEGFVDSVREIMEKFNPKMLIIEPSGIASPSSILIGLQGADYWDRLELAPVVGVVDLTFFTVVKDEDDMGNFFTDQIMNSDIILLNKADLVSAETIEECREKIEFTNPAALIITTVFCQTELPDVVAKGEVKHFHFSPKFSAEVFTFSGVFDRKKIESLLLRLTTKGYGDIFRAKGIIDTTEGPWSFDYVHGLINFGQLNKVEQSKLVFIGQNIDRAKLEKGILGGLENGAG